MVERTGRPIVRLMAVMLLVTMAGALGGAAEARSLNQAAAPPAMPAASPQATPYGEPPRAPVAWIELGPNGVQLARALSTAATCPAITLDGASRAMRTRAAPAGPAFPVAVCETTIPGGTATAAIGGRPLHLLTGTPKRVAVIGDTGCRMASPDDFQACDDPARWPFATIAAQIAAWQPDLIIHVGDYYYREDPCPAGDAGCAGNPTGDTWPSWNADFFTPAAALLTAAPWVFVRGNHETCDRGGNGWFHCLDPRPMPATCQTYTDPYPVPIGDVQLLIMDSSAASDGSAPADQVAEYGKEFATLKQVAKPNAWFLTHRPVWGLVQFGKDRTLATGTRALQAASGYDLPAGVQLSLAGHIHLAEVVSFPPGSRRAPMFIAGNAGTELDDPLTVRMAGVDIGGVPVADGRSTSQFGYLTLESATGVWTATARDTSGAPLWACAVLSQSAGCAP